MSRNLCYGRNYKKQLKTYRWTMNTITRYKLTRNYNLNTLGKRIVNKSDRTLLTNRSGVPVLI